MLFRSLLKDGDFVQKVLHQAKGAQPAADKAPQQAAEQEEKAQRGEGDLKPLLIQQGLQGAKGAGGDGPGAGVAVQPRDTGVFQGAPIDFSVQEAVQIPVCDDGKQQLNAQSKSFHSSPNPDTLQADHRRLFPQDGKLPMAGPGAEHKR